MSVQDRVMRYKSTGGGVGPRPGRSDYAKRGSGDNPEARG